MTSTSDGPTRTLYLRPTNASSLAGGMNDWIASFPTGMMSRG